MGWLIDMVRSWFCRHEWECLLEKCSVWDNSYSVQYPVRYKWLYVCKKCKRKKIITT